jgi:SAM-dependent methyltransferase
MEPTAVEFEAARPADYLLRLATSEEGQAYKGIVLSELGVIEGDVVLDVGCGPGADLTPLAAAAGVSGRVIGLDRDQVALAQAASRMHAHRRVRLTQGDAHQLPLAEASVDRVHTDRVTQHLASPAAALTEIRRVLRPGGKAIFAEPDWDTLVIDYPDLAVARAYSRFVADRVVRNGCIGRQLPALVGQAGMTVQEVIPVTNISRDASAADKVLGLQRVTVRATSAGYISSEQARRWLGHLASEPFFASLTLFIVVAQN